MLFNNGENQKSLPQIELDGHAVIKLQTEYYVYSDQNLFIVMRYICPHQTHP